MKTSISMPSRSLRTLAAAVAMVVACCLLSAPLLAEVYTVRLKSGNEILSKYEPREAWYDDSKLLIMTPAGNIVSLDKADIDGVDSSTEAQGFGVVIDTTTILVGVRPNDAPVFDDETINQAVERASMLQTLRGAGGGGAAAPLNNPLVSEPNAGGGVPVSFINTVTPPIGAPGQN